MALHRCPECRHKISESSTVCIHCGFSFSENNMASYTQKLEQRRLHNEEINRKSVKLHLIWLIIFTLVIGISAYFNQY
ncbi:hypothetical protein A6B43_05120 [Vespertiliibacter pulmonis]|uniref:Uncharacterized protein UPF0547 n=1 Tax=Vespertiliibacter pulmonis TaxID=1443036 RepID=A0A3N4W2E9_9PAST|nr:zinc ribbon domain-containing protein [Vespertiliibacter pulmonis]QLB20949.1 hypothetical protein A6B43_05120 [Vespertiliibacter pulmonis]RPE83607.1 uncharacterized protein UPF0547 [Vespertiliibacter pulmonis]